MKKEILVKAFGEKCIICGYNKAITGLEFHHVNEKSKKFGISQNHNVKWKTLLSEVKKCILVCCRCHREIHENMHDVNVLKQEIDISRLEDYFLRKSHKKINKCVCCGKNTYSKFCSIKCSAKTQEKISWNDAELTDLYINRKVNVLQISKLYNLSYNTIKKRLKKLKIFNIPS